MSIRERMLIARRPLKGRFAPTYWRKVGNPRKRVLIAQTPEGAASRPTCWRKTGDPQERIPCRAKIPKGAASRPGFTSAAFVVA